MFSKEETERSDIFQNPADHILSFAYTLDNKNFVFQPNGLSIHAANCTQEIVSALNVHTIL